jgi:hypothetical protein
LRASAPIVDVWEASSGVTSLSGYWLELGDEAKWSALDKAPS